MPTSSIHIRGEKDGVEVEAVLTWLHKQYAENTWGFVNCIRTHDGGTHIDGLRLAISKALNSYPKKVRPTLEWRL
jgi:DNA gyrase subunit B